MDVEREVFRTVQAGILIVDVEEHRILDANPAALKIMGRSKESVVGQCCHKFVCPSERGKCPITDLHTTVDSSERVMLGVDGNRIPILKSVVPVVLNGRPCLLECFLDLSERKRTEEDLKRAHGDLVRASRLAGMAEVASNVLHNVGNVLNSVNISVDVVSEQLKNSNEISVTDNGIGIAPEDRTRIFSHGFTVGKNGHGFGLHSGALAAQELGGALCAQSDGIGLGATFTLRLPKSGALPQQPAGQ